MPKTTTDTMRALGCVLLLTGLAAHASAQTTGGSTTTSTTTRSYAVPAAPANPTPTAAPAPQPTRSLPADTESGLPDILYIQPFLGGAYVHLKALDASNFDINSMDPSVDDVVVTAKGQGFHYGVAAGLNIVFIHLGGRVSFTDVGDFTLNTAQLEAAIAPKIGPVEPSVRLGIGYAWQGDANYGNYQDQTTVYGLAIGAGFGLDIRLGQALGIGVAGDIDVLNMSRSTDVTQVTTIKAESGSAVGIQLALTGHLTIHI